MNTKELTVAVGALLMLAGCSNETSPETSRNEVAPATRIHASGLDAKALVDDNTDVDAALPEHATSVVRGAAQQRSGERLAAKYLPSEQRLLRQDGIALESVMPLLASPHFDKSVNTLARESANDPEAQQLGRLYTHEAMQSLTGKGQLTGLSCGLSVCMGAVRMASREAAREWSRSFADRTSAPIYSFVSDILQVGASQYESRFVFSTDPAANSVTGVVKPGQR